jgi:L-ribulose-5-phosphate 3-epimerase
MVGSLTLVGSASPFSHAPMSLSHLTAFPTRRKLFSAALTGAGGYWAGSLLNAGAQPGAALTGPRNQSASAAAGSAVNDGELFRISLAQWSLHRMLYAGQLDNLDFPRYTRETFGLGEVEYVNSFFKDHGADFAYLTELKQRCADQGVKSGLIMIDGEGDLGAADPKERRLACERHFRWISAAAYLGCRAIRVNVAGDGTPEDHMSQAAESLHALANVAQDFGLFILVENHGGRSSNGAWLAATMRRADHPRVGTLPDFGNFRIDQNTTYDRYTGVAEMMPFAQAVSAKSHDFDAAGEETGTDFRRMLKIVLEAGYRGPIGIEYEGERLPEVEGVRKTLALLEKVRQELITAGMR